MEQHAAWEGAEQGEEAVEEAATTIFQKIVRSELHWDQSVPGSTFNWQEVPGETAEKELCLF